MSSTVSAPWTSATLAARQSATGGAARTGHASLSSTEVYLAVEAEDLARMNETSHPRERPRSAGPRSKIRW